MRGKHLTKKKLTELKTLREKGASINEICKMTGIPKTTVALHIRNVKILPEYLELWKEKKRTSGTRKKILEQNALDYAKKLIIDLSQKEKLIFISALYWAEGNKKDFILSNTDPKLIKIFVEGLREVFKLPDDRLKVSIRIYEDLDKEKCLSFWSKIVNIPTEKFLSVNILKGKKIGKLQYGMCRVRVAKGGELLKKILSVNSLVHDFFVPIA